MEDRTRSAGSISVVIPVRDEAAKIAACTEGILSQTVQVSEIIVVDSGSTDGTLEILARYPQVWIVRIRPAGFNRGEWQNVCPCGVWRPGRSDRWRRASDGPPLD